MFWFPTVDVKIVTEKRNVNNERIFAEVDNYVMEIIRMDLAEWLDEKHRKQGAEVIEDVLYDSFVTESKVNEHSVNVICDYRNNDLDVLAKGIVHIRIRYQQLHCLNTTELVYTIDLSTHI